jgi:hypothetical protein
MDPIHVSTVDHAPWCAGPELHHIDPVVPQEFDVAPAANLSD